MEANQPANPECDEGYNQPEETVTTEHVISIPDRLEERFRKLKDSYPPVKEEDEGHKPLIGQAPMFLREKTELKTYFKPRIVSFGPVHHGEKELEQGQQYKHQLANLFINNNMTQPAESLYNHILNEIASFKECYDQQELLKFHGNDEDLAWMFFVDGCALIEFVESYDNSFGWFAFYDMNIPDYQIKHVLTDLMLVDNQLPLGVLNLVMGFIKEEGELYQNYHSVGKQSKEFRHSICRFIKLITIINFEGWEMGIQADSVSFNKAIHLLGLLWKNLVKKKNDDRPRTNCMPMWMIIVNKETDYRSDNTKASSRQFRSVKDLQAAGIILEPNNSSSSLRDISFNRGNFFCKLKIPRFRVCEQGKFLVFNLIAFEMHPNFDKDRVVTSYISFLNSLITTKDDVAELRKAGILFNYLPNDEEVLNTFRELTLSLKPYPDIFSDTKEELINYFNDKKSMTTGKWLSEAMHVYFRSPWTTIAFVSATFLLILTIVQTIFSILAYQHK